MNLKDCLKRDRRLGCGQGRPKPSNTLNRDRDRNRDCDTDFDLPWLFNGWLGVGDGALRERGFRGIMPRRSEVKPHLHGTSRCDLSLFTTENTECTENQTRSRSTPSTGRRTLKLINQPHSTWADRISISVCSVVKKNSRLVGPRRSLTCMVRVVATSLYSPQRTPSTQRIRRDRVQHPRPDGGH